MCSIHFNFFFCRCIELRISRPGITGNDLMPSCGNLNIHVSIHQKEKHNFLRQDLSVLSRLTLNSRSFCLSILSARITQNFIKLQKLQNYPENHENLSEVRFFFKVRKRQSCSEKITSRNPNLGGIPGQFSNTV